MDHIQNYYCHLFTNVNICKVEKEDRENSVKIRRIELGCCFQQFLQEVILKSSILVHVGKLVHFKSTIQDYFIERAKSFVLHIR